MKIGAMPEGWRERIGMRSGRIPVPLIMGLAGMGATRCLIAGTKLGIFDVLESGPRSSRQIADSVHCNQINLETLLDALNGMGYLRKHDGEFVNAAIAQKWLTKSSPVSVRDAILLCQDMWDVLGGAEDCMISGGVRDIHETDDPGFWRRYVRGFATFARFTNQEVVNAVKPRVSPRKLLDVGGGHGIYSVAFCKRYPELLADVLELSQAALYGKEIVKEEGMDSRVRFKEGDLRSIDWGMGYDIVLLLQVIHHLSEQEANDAINKAYGALNPGGQVVALEFKHETGEKDLSFPAGMSELYFNLLSGTRSYPEQDVLSWIARAGFKEVSERGLKSVPMTCLLTGIKI